MLYVVQPEPAYLWVGLVLLGVGSVVSEIAGVNYNATIDQVATSRTVGRVSGFGWGMGYLGGILVLLALYFLLIQPDVGLFGVTDAHRLDIRVSMLLCGLWTLVFTIPASSCCATGPGRGAAGGCRHVVPARVEVDPRALGHLTAHGVLPARLQALFRDGLAGVFAFGAILAHGTFGMSAGDVIVFGAAANIVAGFATMGFGLLDDRIGSSASSSSRWARSSCSGC